MVATATGAMLAQSLVPLVIGAVVDGPITRSRHRRAVGAGGVALAFGIGRGRVVLRPAAGHGELGARPRDRLRRDLFAHLQRLPVSFHDQWPSGQLLSRLTTDLSTLRRFVGFGFVF